MLQLLHFKMLARSFQQHVALCLFLLIQLSVQSSQQFYKSDTLTCKGGNKVIAASELKIWSATECVLFCKSSSSSVELVSVYHEANFTCQCFNMVSCTQADQEIKKAKQNETLRTVTSVQVAVSIDSCLVFVFLPKDSLFFQRMWLR